MTTHAVQFHPDQVKVTPQGVAVTLTPQQVLAFVPDDVRALAEAQAQAAAMGQLLQHQAAETPPSPSAEEQAEALMKASKNALQAALDEAEVQYPRGANKKQMALLCAQHGLSPVPAA